MTSTTTSSSTALTPRRARNDGWLSATQPTRLTRFWRTFLPWQLVRFALINLKMLRIIWLSHRSHRRLAPPSPSRTPS